MKTTLKIIACIVVLAIQGCDRKVETSENKTVEKSTLSFDKDSAYNYVQKQVDSGPRVPGSLAHAATAEYLTNALRAYCDTAFVQQAEVSTTKMPNLVIKNIIGSFNPLSKKRILLCAHWDTRPQADEDKNKPTTPADGANDGGSGVGVLLEIARQLSVSKPTHGIDIIFFDAEDMGDRRGAAESWCLGSQHWAKNPHKQDYVARFGILLDMVGAKDAKFAYEQYSWQYAQPYVKQVWSTAKSLGHGKYFVNYQGGQLIDDHVFINQFRGIPTLDIIHFDPANNSGFGEFWHTHEDNMSVIDKNTLHAVGETVLKVVLDF